MNNPPLIPQAFATSGSKNIIQDTRQTGQDEEDATWSTGFPNITMQPSESGGLPPKGMDFNGIFNAISSPIVYLQKGGSYKFDSDYATKIGGYSTGSVLQSNDGLSSYVSLIDNNTTDFNSNPSSIGVAWASWAGGSIKSGIPSGGETGQSLVKKSNADDDMEWKFISGAPVGSGLYHYGTTAPAKYLVCDGSAISRAAYPELYAVIGTTYGEGDGSTTFNLPNDIGKFSEGSTTVGTYKNAGIPNITGTIDFGIAVARDQPASSFVSSGAFYSHVSSYSHCGFTQVEGNVLTSLDFWASNSNPIYGASNTVQPNSLTKLPCIKYE